MLTALLFIAGDVFAAAGAGHQAGLKAGLKANWQVSHTVTFPAEREQVLLLRSEFPVDEAVTELILPTWTPGSYLIREFAANLNKLTVSSSSGEKLTAVKTGKDRWRVGTENIEQIIVEYEIHTPALNVSSSWASRAFSLINGASVFLYTMQSKAFPQAVTVLTGSHRGDVFTAMPRAENGQLRATDYDQLVDNPIAVADTSAIHFTSRGQKFAFLNVGGEDFWDTEQAVKDVKKIVHQTQKFWPDSPLLRPYWFLNFSVEAGGGLEHDHSTVIMTGRRQMKDREDYIKWLGIVAHEFFHVWNVRKMRPAALETYDYQREQYSAELWLAEGLTSYYDDLLLSRSGLITPKEYMELLAKQIHRLEITPGRKLRSVIEASNDAWIRHYRRNSNSVNSTVSYYNKGAIIGFVLDAYLRKSSKGKHDLDEVMREMYQRFASKPYTNADFYTVLEAVGGMKAVRFVRPLLQTVEDLDVDEALDWYGLRIDRKPAAELATAQGNYPQSGFGAIWQDGQQAAIVKAVLAGSSGASAGLMPGDELLAIGDERVSRDGLEKLLGSFHAGDKTTLLIARRGKLLSLEVELQAATAERFVITLQTEFGKRHVIRLQQLLGQKLANTP